MQIINSRISCSVKRAAALNVYTKLKTYLEFSTHFLCVSKGKLVVHIKPRNKHDITRIAGEKTQSTNGLFLLCLWYSG